MSELDDGFLQDRENKIFAPLLPSVWASGPRRAVQQPYIVGDNGSNAPVGDVGTAPVCTQEALPRQGCLDAQGENDFVSLHEMY